MTDAEKREAARQFYQKWVNRGKEDEDDRSYWIDFLQNVMGVDHVTDRIEFQKKVVGPDGNTKRIDVYIPETRVLIEQKSLNIDLSKPQQGHNGMTPYEQAKMYDNSLPVSEKSKWIIISNFAETWVYDMDTRVPEPTKFTLAEIPTKYSWFEFLVNQKEQKISQEMEISVKAGEFVGLIYDALLKQYINPESEETLKSLNMLCVRLVFCLYAEDAHIFGDNGHMFHDYMEQFETKDMRRALIDLFKTLDTPEDRRDPYDTSDLSKFPYVNGGLFADENIEIPNFTDEIKTILLDKASAEFDWSMISPTIFGAVFESTLNPDTRRAGGMHYTSIENIHKVIDPLFLDELQNELEEIKTIQIAKTRTDRLRKYQDKIANIKWLDPACGSGNFLTETFLSVRRLENQVIYELEAARKDSMAGQISFGDVTNPIKVSIQQFYGIEINDFAVTVAKTALWIAESQMLKETEDIIHMSLEFLPLKTNAYIVEGNALRIDWEDVVPKKELNYIMGNPPFIGKKYQSSSQKADMSYVFGKEFKGIGNLDYVCAWYKKALSYSMGTIIKIAFVSTSSIVQGEHIPILWSQLYRLYAPTIIFAHQSFLWDSEASSKASVYCVIIGLSLKDSIEKTIYSPSPRKVSMIHPYLQELPMTFIENRNKPICDVKPLVYGSFALDDGNYTLSEDEYSSILKSEPLIEKYLKPFIGSEEFINNKKRYCIWLKNANISDVKNSSILMKRIGKVKEWRSNSSRAGTQKAANTPMLFAEDRQPDSDYLAIPITSSERRRYIPMGYMKKDIIASNHLLVLPDSTLYEFGILISDVHMAWMRTVAGRLKSDYNYSAKIVYNNFPWPSPTDEQKLKIEQTAQGILDARALYPDNSLADLYDPKTMPIELIKAHMANDKAVMQAYGFSVKNMAEADCVVALMKMYQELTKEEK